MIVFFMEDVLCTKIDVSVFGREHRLLGFCLEHQKDATIIIDNIVRGASYYFNRGQDEEGYKKINRSIIHELIHKVGRWYPEEVDSLVYESPVNDLVYKMLDYE